MSVYLISLGIGSPAAIPEFLLFGLSPNPNVVEAPPIVIAIPFEDCRILVEAESMTIGVTYEDRTIRIPAPKGQL